MGVFEGLKGIGVDKWGNVLVAEKLKDFGSCVVDEVSEVEIVVWIGERAGGGESEVGSVEGGV